MVAIKPTLYRLGQRGPLGTQGSFGPLRERLGVLLARDQRTLGPVQIPRYLPPVRTPLTASAWYSSVICRRALLGICSSYVP